MGLISRVSSRTYRYGLFTIFNMSVNVRTRKYMTNRLLMRKQMIVDVTHGDLATPSCKTIREHLSKMYKTAADTVVVYGMSTAFGGGRSTGFANIYDSVAFLKKYEATHRQVRMGHATKIEKKARQQRKQLKNRKLKVRGTARDKIGSGKK